MARSKSKKVEEEEEYEVNEILDHKRKGKTMTYYVSWVGYDEEDNTWEPAANFHAPDKIEAYWDSLPESKQGDRPKGLGSGGGKRKRKEEEQEDEEDNDEEAAVKKVKKEKKSKKSVNGGAAKKKVKKAKEEQPEEEEEGEDEPIGFGEVDPDRELVEYDSVEIFSKESWEKEDVTIETVERDEDGSVRWNVVWEDGTASWIPGEILRTKCPQKIITFYEEHLKFRAKKDEEEAQAGAEEEAEN
ncbi:Chromatin-associated protein swi6 [Rhodotorula toruloides]|nr:Chromatin-associated protein swi6 [Rhodotorula toruloides]